VLCRSTLRDIPDGQVKRKRGVGRRQHQRPLTFTGDGQRVAID
jgi:hypothetical protein